MRDRSEIDLKVQFLFNVVAKFWDKRGNWSSEKCKDGVVMFQGQIGEIAHLSPGKLGLFLILVLFFNQSGPSQKLGTLTQLKTTFSNKYGTGLSSQKVSS